MKLDLREPDSRYVSGAQKAKDITEDWVAGTMYCPNCGNSKLNQFPANLAVADFFCANCQDQYELKSQKKSFGKKIANGAYQTKIERLNSDRSPNLILVKYEQKSLQVKTVCLVPKRFFVPRIIEKRKPLAATARRAGWVGSNIILEKIPKSGIIYVVNEGIISNKEYVLQNWQKTAFLSEFPSATRGWLLEVMKCVDSLNSQVFSIDDMYRFEYSLNKIYPQNRNVRAKIRQQLQVLRDNGYLEFLGGGRYQLT
jgi:type II restriction enzyme